MLQKLGWGNCNIFCLSQLHTLFNSGIFHQIESCITNYGQPRYRVCWKESSRSLGDDIHARPCSSRFGDSNFSRYPVKQPAPSLPFPPLQRALSRVQASLVSKPVRKIGSNMLMTKDGNASRILKSAAKHLGPIKPTPASPVSLRYFIYSTSGRWTRERRKAWINICRMICRDLTEDDYTHSCFLDNIKQ